MQKNNTLIRNTQDQDKNQNSNRFKPIKTWSQPHTYTHNVEYMHRQGKIFLLLALLIDDCNQSEQRTNWMLIYSAHKFKQKKKKNAYTNKTCVILPTHWNSYQHFTSMYVFIFARNDSSTRKTTFLIKCVNKCDWQNKNQTTSRRREITRRRQRLFIDRFT